MSKSLGNIINFDTYLEKYLPDSYRLLMLTVSYSKPISVTDTLLESINSQLKKFISLYNKVQLENIKQEIDLNIINEILNNVSNLDFAIAYKKILNLFKDKNKSSTFFKLLEILGFVFINNKISQEDKTLYLN
ncbi:cysteinyl-tRNA synthetase [Chlamydia abortus]|jgi:cysteine--tRNA ligase|nr:cysteinyl-tRNA synthetase [Chlamydia abortus]SHE15586.1 cysteinyl-tRNA synthetase [Chlamydia abortus]